MQKKKNKGLWIVVILLVIACGVFAFLYFSKDTPNPPCDNCTIDPSDPTNPDEPSGQEEPETPIKDNKVIDIELSGKTVKYNAYDFIIETLGKAQYWGTDQMPLYEFLDYQEHHWNYLSQTNGTGFKLYDENTATFCRGYEGRLYINFSANTARCNPNNQIDASFNDADTPWKEDENIQEINFNTGEHTCFYKWLVDADIEYLTMYNATKDGYSHFSNITAKERDENGYFYYTNHVYWIIYDTMQYYEAIFEMAGCPLLNQPEGTLTSYKNKTINVPVELTTITYLTKDGSDKISAIWTQEGFAWDWATYDDITWIDNLEDAWDQQFPKTYDAEVKNMIYEDRYGNTTRKLVDYYGGIFIVRCDPSQSNQYLKHNTRYIESHYSNFGGAISTFWLQYVLEQVYGFKVCYFYEEVPSHDESVPALISSDVETKDDFLYNSRIYRDTVAIVTNKGDVTVTDAYQFVDDLYYLVKRVNDILKHYGYSPTNFSRNYIENSELFYNKTLQKELGLR